MNKLFKILLVEDDLDDQCLIDEALQTIETKYHLEFANNGREALAMLDRAEYLPDLILLDLNMPVMNGFEVLTNLQQTNALTRPPVVVLTTSSDVAHVNKSYELGASSFIVKPKNYSELSALAINLNNYWFKTVTLPARKS